MQRKRVFVIDGNNLFRRGYHIAKAKGKNPLAFALEMLFNIKKMEPASRVVFAFDTTKSERRLALFPDYKAKRKSSTTPEERAIIDDLLNKFTRICESTGCTTLHGHGYEADDYIACFTRMLRAGYDVVIISSDQDLYQLINENIRVYDPIKAIFISTENFHHVTGVKMEHFLDYKCILGDESDSIPGFDRIGDKTAKKYIDAYGGYDSIVKAVEQIDKKKKTDVTILDVGLYNRNKELMDLSIYSSDMKLKHLIKAFVDNTKFEEKVLHTVLSEYDLAQFYYPMKGLRLTENVLGNNGQPG